MYGLFETHFVQKYSIVKHYKVITSLHISRPPRLYDNGLIHYFYQRSVLYSLGGAVGETIVKEWGRAGNGWQAWWVNPLSQWVRAGVGRLCRGSGRVHCQSGGGCRFRTHSGRIHCGKVLQLVIICYE